jgi:hypothetical protein
MANQVQKLNSITLTDIETFNGKTEANIEKINGKTFAGLTAGTWSDSGNNLTTGRSRVWGAGATRSSMIIGNGQTTSITTIEYYNGSANASVQTGKDPSQAWGSGIAGGVQTDCVKAQGFDSDSSNASQDDTEEWNGTSWSNNTTSGYNCESPIGAGESSTAFTIWGGYTSQTNQSVVTGRTYNGSTWSDAGDAAPAPIYAAGSGADNNQSVIALAGYYDDDATSASSSFGGADKCWYYNGSSWSNKSEGAAGSGGCYSAFGGGVTFGQTFTSAGNTYLTGDSGATFSSGGGVATGLGISSSNPYSSTANKGGNRCGKSNVAGGTIGGDYAAAEGSNSTAILNFDR